MPRGEHRPSLLLSREENDQVFGLIGPKCQSLATAVVQLFTTEGPAHLEWKKRDTGVLCLIKDNAKRSYFFRIFCLYRKSMIWEHEVYTQIEYKSPRPFLHTFEAEEYMTAFNFANEDEARLLRMILIEKIELRKTKREEKRQRALLAARSNPIVRQNGSLPPTPTPVPKPEPAPTPVLPPKATLPANNSNYNTLSKRNKKVKGRITKADIGMPQDFKHISHVGWDAQKGFDVDKLPNEDLRSFLSKAGVSETQLQDQDTREFIYGFIETHGGLDAVKEDLDQAKPAKGVSRPPPLPLISAPPVPERSPAVHPPAPPSRAPPPPPARAVPPPPPPVPRNPPPPRPIQPPATAPPSVPPPPPPGLAPPPPPPPPPQAPPPPLAPPPPPDVPVVPDARAMLMESIRSGSKTLKRVEVSNDQPPPVEDSRSNLLSDIRKGISLKKTEVSRSTSSSGSSVRGAGACGLAGALARALEERSRAIHSSDSDLSDTSDMDDEWD